MNTDKSLIDRSFQGYRLIHKKSQIEELKLQIPPYQYLTTNKGQTGLNERHSKESTFNGLFAYPYEQDGFHFYFVDINWCIRLIKYTELDITCKHIFDLKTIENEQSKESPELLFPLKGKMVVSFGNGMILLLEDVEGSWVFRSQHQPLGRNPIQLLCCQFDGDEGLLCCLIKQLNHASSQYKIFYAAVSTSEGDAGDSIVQEIAAFEGKTHYSRFISNDKIFLIHEGSHESFQIPENESIGFSDDILQNDLLMEVKEANISPGFPRAGIGFHSHDDQSKKKSDISLKDRFTPSNGKENKEDEELTSMASSSSRDMERPTPDSILAGFEECDRFDPSSSLIGFTFNISGGCINGVAKCNLHSENNRFLCCGCLPCSKEKNCKPFSLMFQSDINGFIYYPNLESNETKLVNLDHKFVFQAFGFVQASKEQKKFMGYDSTGRLAVISEFEKRLYIYHNDENGIDGNRHTQAQEILELGDEVILGMHIEDPGSLFVLTNSRFLYINLGDRST